MKILLTLLFALSLSATPLYMQDDKQKHILGSMAIGTTATGLAKHYGSNTLEAIMIGVATSVLVGVAKEAIDGQGHGTADINDIYADTLGGIAGSVISAQFSWKF